MYPGAICSAVHAATRCAFAITTLHPGSNLKNLVYEEGKKRGSLHLVRRRTGHTVVGSMSKGASDESRWNLACGNSACDGREPPGCTAALEEATPTLTEVPDGHSLPTPTAPCSEPLTMIDSGRYQK